MDDPHGVEGKPQRAHSLVGVFSGDTAESLAIELERFSDDIRAGRVTVGVSGGPVAGSIYSYRVAPEQTHDAYFDQIQEWLERRKETQSRSVNDADRE